VKSYCEFLIGGAVVSAFALLGDLFKPKSFAGLFGAAPSVALATVALTLSLEGARYVATEAFGAIGLRIDRPDQITSTLRKAFDTPGPVLVGVHVDYRQNVKLFEQVYEGSIM